MTTTPDKPTPINTPRSPLATGTTEQKVRYDALIGILREVKVEADFAQILEGAAWVELGDDDADEEES